MARRTKEDAEKTRESLLDAAERVFLEKGVAAASLQDIAREAGVTRGAVYWHFKDKCDLFRAMHERVKLPIDTMFDQAVLDECPLDALRKLCIYALKSVAEDGRSRRVYTILMFKCAQDDPQHGHAERQHQKRAEMIERSRKIFASAKKSGYLAQGLSAEEAAIALHAFMSGIFNDYLRDPAQYDIDTLAPKMVNAFFRGITRQQ